MRKRILATVLIIAVLAGIIPSGNTAMAVILPANKSNKESKGDSIISEYVYITVNFLDESGVKMSNPNVSEIEKNTKYDLKIQAPVILGYGAYYNPENLADTESANATKYISSELIYSFSSVTKDETINVFYKPIDVPYAVKYFFQNVNDDLYTERTDLYRESYAKTGTTISDKELAAPEADTKGFRVLYHYPEQVAADGSTVFEMYYDREYYKVELDLAGGYGTDDYYLRYGSTYSVNQPKQAGYTFAGWDELTTDNDGDGIPDTGDGVVDTFELTGTIPDYNHYYRALWTPGETNVTYVVWTQNADSEDDGTYSYSYLGSYSERIEPGTVINGSDIFANNSTANTIVWDEKQYFTYNNELTSKDVTVKGDGTTVVNIVYDRKDYTLNFYYAREKYIKTVTDIYEQYKTGPFSWSEKKYNRTEESISNIEYEIPVKINKFSESIESLENALKLKNGDSNDWITVKNLPILTLTETVSTNLQDSELRKTESEGYVGSGRSEYEYRYNDITTYYTYHGIQITGKYGSNLVSKWPTMCFETVYDTGSGSYEFSAWGPENSTYYIQHTNEFNNNPTVKGMFLTLDYRLLYDGTKGESNTINFLSYWANVNHNTAYPLCEWRYNMYVEPYKGQNISGMIQKDLEGKNYSLLNAISSFDSNGKVESQTPPILKGFNIHKKIDGSVYTEDTGRGIMNQKYPEGIDGFYVNYYYDRNFYDFTLNNHGEQYAEHTVGFNEPMQLYNPAEPPYPTNLEEDAFEFAGWYTTPTCAPGTEYNFETERMPNHNLALYAKYVPIVHTVNFFETFEDYENHKNGTATISPYDTRQVEYGDVVGKVTVPTYTDESGEEYSFAGWFYIKNGRKTAFDPNDTPVKKIMNVFADWGTKKAQPYVIHYVLKSNPGVKVADDTVGYAYQGTTRTFIPQGGKLNNSLYEDYNTGYYPTVQSHSLTIKYEPDKENPSVNVFTFYFVNVPNVSYTVEYKDINTGENILEPVTQTTNLSVVTEKFKYKEEYAPDAFYKRKVLSVVEDENGNWLSSPDNIVTFYYTKSSKTMYAIHYMLQTPGTDNYTGSGDYVEDNYVEQKYITEGYLDRDNLQLTPKTIRGYKMLPKAYQKMPDGTMNEMNVEVDGSYTTTYAQEGVELYVYFDCNEYNYSVKFLDMNKRTESGAMTQIGETWVSKVQADYGQKITINLDDKEGAGNVHVLPDTAKPDSTMYTPIHREESIVIREGENVITFLCVPVQYTVQYDVYDDGSGILGGTLSKPSETVDGNGKLEGSVPVSDEGYKFDGWYKDKDCKEKVDSTCGTIEKDTNKFIPDIKCLKPSPEENHYYVKFVSKYGNLTIDSSNDLVGGTPIVYNIKKDGQSGNGINVVINGNSETIYDLPTGSYTITEKNSTWSWRYGNDTTIKAVVNEGKTTKVKFMTEKSNKKWFNAYDIIVNSK